MSMPTWLSDVFGVVGTLGFMLMLVPQVLEILSSDLGHFKMQDFLLQTL